MPRSPRAAQLGVSRDDYDRLLAAQGGHCALCPSVPKSKRLAVDHDHKTGRVRGLLCYRCNRALPAYVDASWLAKASMYVGRFTDIQETTPSGHPVVDIRLDEMRELRATGTTYADIAKRYGISRQRVHQLIGKP